MIRLKTSKKHLLEIGTYSLELRGNFSIQFSGFVQEPIKVVHKLMALCSYSDDYVEMVWPRQYGWGFHRARVPLKRIKRMKHCAEFMDWVTY